MFSLRYKFFNSIFRIPWFGNKLGYALEALPAANAFIFYSVSTYI